MWILFAVLTVLMWGSSDVFFKRASEKEGSVIDLIAYNGVVLFIVTLIYMLAKGLTFNFDAITRYIPVAGYYITSMFFYYGAFKIAKVSIVSPVGNASCAITTLACVFLLGQSLMPYQIFAVALIIISIILLSVSSEEKEKVKKKAFALGVLISLVYTVLDGLGSFFDELYIEKYVVEQGAVTEDDVIVAMAVLYGFVGLCALIYKVARDKRKAKEKLFEMTDLAELESESGKENVRNVSGKVFEKADLIKLAGALLETGGQYTYIYTFARADAAIASPFIASFCVVSIVLSRIFLKEKMTKRQYVLVALVIAGMFILSIE